ncbi:alpha/beta fold hydrolase [Paraburkholderia silvatlantica]|uniref:3-oxoadipate enol-lactonase n=1 Tax=Paraburkholderia silvatlantica TaxID=321895 RepID=A0ABR6FKS3_9BURK|nr:alpha/beta hydrolase [Paraburkholderia silvatlantica]MBB2927993.1 3-oxoadipate enol-lactonase [Paraburkholderia silvatlantica]PVY17634.1 3-oxoadipate enol-lactonase [Paraburkholderia silvatlantica]PXW23546.1 3-oxoadipate enol-lactonase [Paraburkholderia silvatlantica]
MSTVSTVLGPIHVDDQGSACGEPVALLWPSLFTDHQMWGHQVAALRTAGWRTLAVDPPGHGLSPGPGRTFTMDECAEAVVQVLDAMGVFTPVVLFGASWGGIVAPRAALRIPDRVKGLVLFNTTAERPTWFSRANCTLLTLLLALPILDRMVDHMIMSRNLAPATRVHQPQLGANLASRFRSWDRNAVINTVRSVLVDRDGALDRLSSLKVPVLIVSGEQDTVLPSIFSRRIAQTIPNARHVEVSGAAHLVALEQPLVANTLILDFKG